MPWRNAKSLPFTRIDVAAHLPSAAGVYGLMDGDSCIFVGEAWNLKARLLELAAVVSDSSHLKVVFELCDEDERLDRKRILASELVGEETLQT